MRSMMRRIRGAAFAAYLAALVPVAHAQLGRLDDSVVQAISLNAEQKDQLQKFLLTQGDKLKDKDPSLVRAGRTAIIETLARPNVSADFRLQSTKLLQATLADLIKDSRETNAINALVVAGDLATEESARLAEEGFKAKGPAVRYQAAFAITRSFEALQVSAAQPMLAGTAAELARRLEARLAKEPDAMVTSALIHAALTAASTTRQDYASVRQPAVDALCKGLAARADFAGKEPIDPAILDATLAALTSLRDVLGSANFENDTLRQVALLAGTTLANAAKLAANKKIDEDPSRRERYAQIAAAGETLLGLVGQKLGKSVALPGLAATLRQAKAPGDAKFVEDVGAALATLRQAPFSLQSPAFDLTK